MKIDKTKFTAFLILILALLLRFYGLNWDQGSHLHPDERFLTMVSSSIRMPSSVFNYFSQKESLFNPYNYNYNFYVYGTFPLLITRFFGELFKMTGYDNIFLVGRVLSILFDTFNIFLIYFLSQMIFRKKSIGLWSSFFYAIAVSPIQLAHFFTVDSFTVFFSTLTMLIFFLFLQEKKIFFLILAGFSMGLTLASKISIAITIPLFYAVIVFFTSPLSRIRRNIPYYLLTISGYLIIFSLFIGLSFRIFQPYAFDGLYTIYPHFIQNITDASKMITGEYDYPPNIQWVYTTPLLWPLKNIFLWGLGPILALLSFAGIFYSLFYRKYRKKGKLFFILCFMMIIFCYQGIQFAKYMRYIYPLYPFFALFAGLTAYRLIHLFPEKSRKYFLSFLVFFALLWPLSFIAIYNRPHSRVMASQWIYGHVPSGSTLTSEEWDDSLPLGISGYTNTYKNISLGIYNTETLEKWRTIYDQLSRADYIILSSNRLYGSIPRFPERYPVASLYYYLLFKEQLGFKKVAEITSYPTLQIPYLSAYISPFIINDDSAEESFTVFDHPHVYIFKKEGFTLQKFSPLLDINLINMAKNENPAETNFFYKFLKRK